MSQQNLEILGEEWIALSPVESKYSGLTLREDAIAAKDSIAAKDYLVPVDFIASEEIIASAGSIDLANFSESEKIIWSEALIGSEPLIDSEAFIKSEGFFTSEGSDSEYSRSQEDSLALQYSESTGNPIFFQETNLEDSLTSKNPISLQERTALDPLTGMANNAMPNSMFNGMFNGFNTNALRHPQLSINLSTGIPNHAVVTTTVKVELSPLVNFLISFNLVDFTLRSNVWGIDGSGWFQGGADDYLFGFSDQEITGSGTYSFSRIVPKGWLNEDHILFNHDDEIQGRFNLVSSDNAFPLNLEARSDILRGHF